MNNERFHASQAAKPLRQAVAELADHIACPLEELDGRQMGELLELAERSYGEERLPEFWRVWRDWSGPDQMQSMGDL